MGVVFRGFDPSISRPVAIKVIRSQHSASEEQDREARMRFSREANAAGRLSHPNIVTIYQLGEDRGYQYMAMEYVEGDPLNKIMAPGVPMDPDKALDIVRQVADALDHAHQQEVVHRDVKPPNVLIRPDGRVKIADFGIARVASQTLTQQGIAMGTPAYMAPEQIQGLKVDGRADQFSLAVMAYQMLAGQRPFDAPTEETLILSIMSNEPKQIHDVNSALPPACSAVLHRALMKDPANRYPSCGAFSQALAASLVPAAEPAPVERTIQVADTPATPRGHREKLVVGALALAVIGIWAFIFLGRQHPLHKPAPPPVANAAAAQTPVAPSVARVPVSKTSRATAQKEPASRLSPEELQTQQERQQITAALETKRQQLKTELGEAQSNLDDLRAHSEETDPDVQAAIKRVDSLRKSLDDTSTALANLKSAK